MSEPTYGASFRRDGMTIRHETEVEGAFGTPKAPARFTREDVEKAAEAWCNHFGGDGWFTNFTDGDRKMYFEAATAALSAIGDVEHG